MQFKVLALFASVAVAAAVPVSSPIRQDDLIAREPQTTQAQPSGEAPAMSNAAGDVVSFDHTAVYLAAGGPA